MSVKKYVVMDWITLNTTVTTETITPETAAVYSVCLKWATLVQVVQTPTRIHALKYVETV